MPEISMLQDFEKVQGNICVTILLPKNAKLNLMETPEDLKEVLSGLLKGLEKGEYPFLIFSLAPLAYGKVLKKHGGPKKSSS